MTARASVPAIEPTHACVRCGDPIPLEDAMCERCNPLGLKQPASSQAHGTVFIGIAVAIFALAILGRYALAGVGPFTGTVTGVKAGSPNLIVTLSVTNHGTREGATTCRVFLAGDSGIGPDAAFVLSPQIPPGSTVSFAKPVTTLGSTVKALDTECT
jgi:predicted nucleic acid-binding Zn ribbon protein